MLQSSSKLSCMHAVSSAFSPVWCVSKSSRRQFRQTAASAQDDKATFFNEEDYQTQKQAHARAEWAANVRAVTGHRHHRFWEPELSPPPLMAQVTVVLISPRRPVSVGTVARACSCFEVEDIRIVAPRCDYISRHSKSASKGAQYILHRMQLYDDVVQATQDCDLRVAFTRGCPLPLYDLPALPKHPLVSNLIRAPVPDNTDEPYQPRTSQQGPGQVHAHGGGASAPAAPTPGTGRPVRVALVFGREDLGMSDQEVSQCDIVCSIPIGRLQESLSLSHAVSLACNSIFQERLSFIAPASAPQGADLAVTLTHQEAPVNPPSHATPPSHAHVGHASAEPNTPVGVGGYRVKGRESLAAGYDENMGQER